MRLSSSHIYGKAIWFCIFLTSIIPAGSVMAQLGRTGVPFLLAPSDARGLSLAGGGSVYSTGAMSAFYNPACLVTCGAAAAEFGYFKYMPELSDDIDLVSFCFARSFSEAGFYGLGYKRLNLGKQTRIDEVGNILGESSTYEYAISINAGINFDRNNSIGIGLKYIKSQLSHVGLGRSSGVSGASTFAIDLGVLSRDHFPQLTFRTGKISYPTLRKFCRARDDQGMAFGLSLSNLGPGISYLDADQKDSLPRRLRLAAGYQIIDTDQMGFRFMTDATKLLVDMDSGIKTEWQEIVWSFSFEGSFFYIIHLRLGKLNDRIAGDKRWTAGFGIGPEWLRFDYGRVLDDFEEPVYSLFINVPIGGFRVTE